MGIHVKVNRNKLYLDIYLSGERHSESLHMTLTGDAKQDRETRRLAEQCRAIREAQLLTQAYGLVDTIGGKQSLYEYLKNMGAERDRKNRINKVLKYLGSYPGGESIQIGQVGEKWFKGFQSYLAKSSGLSLGTASSYAAATV
ncbi:MAG: phage integrase SAM-like domain-containing protein [Treponema sp.]|jgi:hypothetical protein|nr:phage integrase SAM-like domain-containing protein [Treponema sp.]